MRIGLTGGIASGKSSVAQILDELSIPVVDADVVSRAVMRPGSLLFQAVIEAFGDEILNEDRSDIDRARLGERVFRDPGALEKLNSLTHPVIWDEIRRQVEVLEQSHEVVVVMVPLLLENGRQDWVDEVWVVALDESIQKVRLMARNGLTEQQAMDRIHSQMPLEEKINLADRVIDNSGTLQQTRSQIISLLAVIQPIP